MLKAVIFALAISLAALPAQAGKKSSASGASLPSSQIAGLTAAECNKAQGAVINDNSCATGAACVKEGPNGPSRICLSFSQ